MVTTNLSLNTVNSSDLISPEPFNSNFEIIDNMGLDYIVDQGKSGEWYYRKWKSGIGELWCNHNFTTTKQGYINVGIRYPWTFTDNPAGVVSAGVAGRVTAQTGYVGRNRDVLDTYVIKDTTQNLACWVSAHIIGNYK